MKPDQSTKEIVIVGTGQVGSRHLQGLSLLPSSARIYCVDLSPESRELAKNRWEEVRTERHQVSFFESMSDVPADEFDLAILATTSAHRRESFNNLVDAFDVEYIIFEKILFQQFDAYKSVQRSLDEHNISAWVNCVRRSQTIYQNIRQEITGTPVDIEVTGNDWALASNGIHFADLFSWLTGSTDIEWNRSLLADEIFQNKRDGYKEVMGRLSATDGESNTLTLRCFSGQPTNPTVRISTPDQQWNVWEEADFIVHRSFSDEGHVSMEKSAIEREYQSELTGGVVAELFQDGDCCLTAFEESCQHHIPYLHTIRDHINEVGSTEFDVCPIT